MTRPACASLAKSAPVDRLNAAVEALKSTTAAPKMGASFGAMANNTARVPTHSVSALSPLSRLTLLVTRVRTVPISTESNAARADALLASKNATRCDSNARNRFRRNAPTTSSPRSHALRTKAYVKTGSHPYTHRRPPSRRGNADCGRWPMRHSMTPELKRGAARSNAVAPHMAASATSTLGQRRRATARIADARLSDAAMSRRSRSPSPITAGATRFNPRAPPSACIHFSGEEGTSRASTSSTASDDDLVRVVVDGGGVRRHRCRPVVHLSAVATRAIDPPGARGALHRLLARPAFAPEEDNARSPPLVAWKMVQLCTCRDARAALGQQRRRSRAAIEGGVARTARGPPRSEDDDIARRASPRTMRARLRRVWEMDERETR